MHFGINESLIYDTTTTIITISIDSIARFSGCKRVEGLFPACRDKDFRGELDINPLFLTCITDVYI